MATEEQVRDLKRRRGPALLADPGVSGVGIERDEAGDYVLAVHLCSSDPDVRERVERELVGLPVVVIASDRFRALPQD